MARRSWTDADGKLQPKAMFEDIGEQLKEVEQHQGHPIDRVNVAQMLFAGDWRIDPVVAQAKADAFLAKIEPVLKAGPEAYGKAT